MDARLEGLTLKAIAIDMGLSIGTVARYFYDARLALGARTSGGALRRYRSWRQTNVEWYQGINRST